MEGRMRGGYSGRRIVASRRGSGKGNVNIIINNNNNNNNKNNTNVIKKLQSREICSKPHRAFASVTASHRFRSMRLTHQYDTHDPSKTRSSLWPFLMKRTKVVEIVAAKNVVFALYHSGLCAAFSRETDERICFLNVCPDEVIRSLFYNKNNDSLITVSVYASENFCSLKCRSTKIEYIRRGKPDAGFPLFQSESLKWPGFVEFDDVNGKVFDLKNYTLLYSISDRNVQEIKISPGIMLLIYNRTSGHIPLKIISIEDGTILKVFNHLLHRNKKVDFIEQFNEKLLVKQENENLQILDVRSSELMEVSRLEFMTPSAFIFLYENQLFLSFRNRTVSVWNFRGELVTSFEDHQLWHPDCNTNNIYITSDQDLIISYCKADSDDQWIEGTAGSINVSNILTGKCVAKITAISSSAKADECRSSGCSCKKSHSCLMRSPVAEALEDITALFYDEDRNEIYTGNRHETNERICFLNVCPHEVIHSLFYNKYNDSLITVFVNAHEIFNSFKCRSKNIEYIRRGKPDAGFPLFQSECLKWSGYVEISSYTSLYFDQLLLLLLYIFLLILFLLYAYYLMFCYSSSIMLLIFNRISGHIPLKITSIENGTVLKTFKHLLHQNKQVDFIELFHEKLLVKQENENQLFLTFINGTVSVWSFCGELVTQFEDHQLWHPDCYTNNTYITKDQDLIISYCKADSDDQWMEGNVAEALEEVTALFYDEDRNEIYAGNRHDLDHK
ncbi:hypothetical protein HKD37_09G026756 [Glycine soja]